MAATRCPSTQSYHQSAARPISVGAASAVRASVSVPANVGAAMCGSPLFPLCLPGWVSDRWSIYHIADTCLPGRRFPAGTTRRPAGDGPTGGPAVGRRPVVRAAVDGQVDVHADRVGLFLRQVAEQARA